VAPRACVLRARVTRVRVKLVPPNLCMHTYIGLCLCARVCARVLVLVLVCWCRRIFYIYYIIYIYTAIYSHMFLLHPIH